MNRRFQLSPDGADQQRLRVRMSLVDIHSEEGFDEVVAPCWALVAFAQTQRDPGHNEILFINHTQGTTEFSPQDRIE